MRINANVLLAAAAFASAGVAAGCLNGYESKEEAISALNDYDKSIEIDEDKMKAAVGGKEVSLSSLLAIPSADLKQMIDNNQLTEYLNENLDADVDEIDGKIEINSPYATRELIVNTSDEAVLKGDNVKYVKKIDDDFYVLGYDTAQETKDEFEALSGDNVAVCRNIKLEIMDDDASVQSVPENAQSTGVVGTGLDNYKTKLEYAGNNKEVRIAVLDSGINPDHEAFTDKTARDRLVFEGSHDYVNNDDDVADDHGHGTMVASVIAQSTPTNIKIVPVKVMNSSGQGNLATIMEAMKNIYKKVDIINLSLGIRMEYLEPAERVIFDPVMKRIYDDGTIMVAAAGNNRSAVTYPGSSPYVLTASSVDVYNRFSSSFSNYGNEVDFAAPGDSMLLADYKGNQSYVSKKGTSFASPFLASAVASIKADYGYTSRDDIVNVLKQNAIDLGAPGKDPYYGWGSIDFNSYMFKSPVLASFKEQDNWSRTSQFTIKAVGDKNIQAWAITDGTSQPWYWNNIYANSNKVTVVGSTSTSGNKTVWLKDTRGNVSSAGVVVRRVDSTVPVINTFSASANGSDAIYAEIAARDGESGISQIKWYYKAESDSRFNEAVDTFATSGDGVKGSTVKSHTFSNLKGNTKYTVYAAVTDMAGNVRESQRREITTQKTISGTETKTDRPTKAPSEPPQNQSKNPADDGMALTEVGYKELSGWYTIKTFKNTGYTIDISGAGIDNYANSQIYQSNNTAAQRFYFEPQSDGTYIIKTGTGSEKVLDVASGSRNNGTNVWQYEQNNTNAQKWRVYRTPSGKYVIKSAVGGNECLDVAEGYMGNGANIQTWEYVGNPQQKWELTKVGDPSAYGNLQRVTRKDLPDGTYRIASAQDTSKVLDVSGAGTENGSNIQIYQSNATAAQRFKIEHVGNDEFVIKALVGSDKVLDVSGGSYYAGANIQIYQSNGTKAQRWRIYKTTSRAGTAYVIRSCTGDVCLDICGGADWYGNITSSQNVISWGYHNADTQRWVLTKL